MLFSWQSRQLETLAQRVEVARIFALSKLYYVAQVLPLPAKFTKKINSNLSKFIFRGRHEKLKLDELENSCEQGGLGLPNIAVKADYIMASLYSIAFIMQAGQSLDLTLLSGKSLKHQRGRHLTVHSAII